MDGRTDQWMDKRTKPLIELLFATKNETDRRENETDRRENAVPTDSEFSSKVVDSVSEPKASSSLSSVAISDVGSWAENRTKFRTHVCSLQICFSKVSLHVF